MTTIVLGLFDRFLPAVRRRSPCFSLWLSLHLCAIAPLAPAMEFGMTHHAPMGAWSSLTFGLPGGGVGIETEALGIQSAGDLIVACSRGKGATCIFPFFTKDKVSDFENATAGDAAPKAFEQWKVVPPSSIVRQLTPSTDMYSGAGMRLTVVSPRMVMAGIPAEADLESAMLPALVITVDIDNASSDLPATGFIGLAYRGPGRIRALDWSDPTLCGIAYQDKWALAAQASPGVFTIRASSVASFIESGQPVIHPGGNEGGIGFIVKPRTTGRLSAVFGFYRSGSAVTQGIESGYYYAQKIRSVEQVCQSALTRMTLLTERSERFDQAIARRGGNKSGEEMLSLASQGYYANSSFLVDGKGIRRWNICEGQFGWRNTLDLAADHLPYELFAHPWIARNVIDGFIDDYSYADRIRFDGPGTESKPGGMSFTHDQGNYTAYSPRGTGAYEQSNRTGLYSFMTTEQLLNGIYCASAYAIAGKDPQWSKERLPVARALLESLLRREGDDAMRKDGILRGQSDRVGTGSEITTYDSLDHNLQNSRGNLYIVIKTWCAAIMLESWFGSEGDGIDASAARALADRAAVSLVAGFNDQGRCFPPNLVSGGDTLTVAAFDPLAVPISCGLSEGLKRSPALLECLRRHAETCMTSGCCLDAESGGIRLSASSWNTWPSKVALVMAGIGWLHGTRFSDVYPKASEQLERWVKMSSRQATVSDQIDVRNGRQISGAYYPRLVTVFTLLQ